MTALMFCMVSPLLAPSQPVTVKGWGFEIGELQNGAKAFRNRDYTLERVPEAWQGWQFTRLDGGGANLLIVSLPEDGVMRLITATRQTGIDLDGWTAQPDTSCIYTAGGEPQLVLYTRPAKAGEEVKVPNGNWSGGIVIAPRLKAEHGPLPEPDLSLVPGVVIDYQPAHEGAFVGSPSIVILPDGKYLASHDIFGKADFRTTLIFESKDRGQTWSRVAELKDSFWATLFRHHGAVYLMGTTSRYGHVSIRRSDDGGQTWTSPADEHTGLLLTGRKFHCAPVPVIEHDGRLWRAYEDGEAPGGWGPHFRAFMMSAPVDADLLRASNWTSTNALPSDAGWRDGFHGWLEGNAVVTPDGEVVDILRVDMTDGSPGTAAICQVNAEGTEISFDPATGFIDFPGGCTKFTIRFDPESGCYWTLANQVVGDYGQRLAGGIRNTLALLRSPDLRTWETRAILLHHDEVVHHGFQYVDWQFDGEDLVVASRTSYDDGLGGAHNFHDANFLTFHRVEGFRAMHR